MCGITGIMAFTDNGLKHLSYLDNATQALVKRGPDGEGTFIKAQVALGHKRLSIIDTSANASQPFTDSSGRYTIVFNGEIFNYKQLKENLELKGFAFKSNSDTEVLLYLYIQKKEKCLQELDGEFAFAIYDDLENTLFLARDRYGIKPLYYLSDSDKFIFASELKGITAYNIMLSIDKASLSTYLQLNYIPAPYTIYKEVKKIPSGHYVYISNSVEVKPVAYYSIPYHEELSNVPTYERAVDTFKVLLEESVASRMLADVPLGSFLSGGVDSSIVTAIAARHTKKLNTFSVGFADEPLFDETYYADLVSKKHQTNHTVFKLSNSDLYQHIFELLDYMDEPFADSSALAVSILSKYTRNKVTVALSGDGADELFGGYNKHAAELELRNNAFLKPIARISKPVLNILPKSRNTAIGNKFRQFKKFGEGALLNHRDRYWLWASFCTEENIDTLLLDNALNHSICAKRKSELLKNISDNYNSVLYTDVKLVLENDMLVKVDRMSMLQSLEVRVPFLDQKIVDFAFSLPSDYKIDKHRRKKILVDAFKSDLPEEVLNRKKQGFEVPLLKWFKTEFKSIIEDDLLNKKFIIEQGIFNVLEVESLKRRLYSASPDDAVARIWALIVFQYWWKKTSHLLKS